MARYTVTLRADKQAYPCCCPTATWWNKAHWKTAPMAPALRQMGGSAQKPSYLFALVAGSPVCRNQPVKTRSGTDHLLQVYVRPATWTRPNTP